MASVLLLVSLLLWTSATSAPSCSEMFCPLAWVSSRQRGDGLCDLSCNTALCGFDGASGLDFSLSDCYQECAATTDFTESLGDSVCQTSLESGECGWDAGDCGYCSAGCFEASLGNGVCEEACNTLACSFDGGDCVCSRQGYCSSGCFLSMLEDQTCHPECVVETCDYGVCKLCAPGCYPLRLGDGICDSECYTEACSWDLSDCNCAPGCMADMLGNGICDSACYVEKCEWDYTDCQCAVGCPYSELGQGKAECLVPACNFDAWNWTAASCANSTTLSCTQASFSYSDTTNYKYTANFTCRDTVASLTLTYCEYLPTNLTIYPVNGRSLPDLSSADHPVTYYVTSGLNSSGSGTPDDPFQSLEHSFNQANQMYVDLILLPGIYAPLGAHQFASCFTNTPLSWSPTNLLPQPRNFPNKRVRVSAHCGLSPCALLQLSGSPQCFYSLPEHFALEFSNLVFEKSSHFTPFCSARHDCVPVLFSVPRGSSLTFTNVTFRLLFQTPMPMIGLVQAKLELNNVDFLNISMITFGNSPFNALIASNSSAEVVYRGGTVSLLNDYITYKSVTQAGFLSISQGSVLLAGVHFTYNYVNRALLAFTDCVKCKVTNCVFAYNFGTLISSAAMTLKEFSGDWEEAQTIVNRSLEVVNCEFENNTGQVNSALMVQFGPVCHRVTVQNCSFTQEYTESYGVVVIGSSGFRPSKAFWKFVYSSEGRPYNVSFPAALISLQDLTFENCTVGTYGLLVFALLPRLQLSNIQILGYGRFGNVDSYTNTLNAIVWQSQLPLSVFTVPLSPCVSIVNFTGVAELVIEGMRYQHMECALGLYFTQCGKGRIAALVVASNRALEPSGAVLLFNFTDILEVDGIEYSENHNDVAKGQATILLTASLSINNGQFAKNRATNGGVFYCCSVGNVSISNSSFSDNTALSGGALYMEMSASLHSSVYISASAFQGNAASTLGGVLAFALEESSSTLSLLITNSTFLRNSSPLGSAVHISSVVRSQVVLVDCHLAGNVASEVGSLYLAAGSVSLVHSVFEGNSAQEGSGVYRDCSSLSEECTLSCSHVSFLGNTGAAICLLPSRSLQSFTALQLLCTGNSGSCLSFDSTIAQCHYCEFKDNTASAGAGFFLSHSNLTLAHMQASNNSVTGNGGVGMLDASSYFLCQHADFTNNTAHRQGGALYLKDSSTTISDTNFSSNAAQEGGFALSLYRSQGVTSSTLFAGNFGVGIGVISLLFAVANFTSCLITDNQYSKLTGGISIYLSDVFISSCQFSHQRGYSGTFLYISQSSVLAEESSLSDGTAVSSGGAAALVTSSVQLRGCLLANLTSQLGGAIFLQTDSVLVLSHCELKNITVGKTDRGVVNGYRSSIQVLNSTFSNFSQGAVAGQEVDLLVFRSLFQQAVGNSGGAVSCLNCQSVQISTSTFRNLSAVRRGGALYLAGRSGTGSGWVLENSRMEGCEAPQGGAVLAENCSLAIVESEFVSNKALGQGGAVLLVGGSLDHLEVKGNSFVRNSAGLQGGAVSWSGSPPDIAGNSFTHNSARYGNDIASFTIQLELASESPTLISCASGQFTNATLTLRLLDHYGQLVTSDNSSYALLASHSATTSFAGTTQVLATMGLFTFSAFSIIAPPGLNTSISITTTALNSSVTILVAMRKCILGEAESNGQCVPCAYGSYSLLPGTSCKVCPAEAYCYGNYSLGPRAGYWRPNNVSELFLACPYAAACLGSSLGNLTGQCVEGHEGNMCQSCSVGYFRWSRVRCSLCPTSVVRTVVQLVLWFVILVVLVSFIVLTVKAGASSRCIPLKIFLNYLQLVMLFDSFDLAWPDLMLQLFNAQEAVGGFPEYLFSFNCLYTGETELQEYERKLVVLSFLQPLLIAISTGVWLVVAVSHNSLSYAKNQALGTGVVLFFVAFPSVMRVMLGALHCKEILPGEYWVVGLQLRCGTASHLKYALGLAVPCVLLWGLAVPALLFVRLHRHQSNESSYHVRYGFLTAGYSQYYWEYVVIYRKLVVIVLIVGFAQVSLFIQALSALGVLLVSVALQNFYKPYSQPVLNSLEMRSLTVTTLTLYSGLLFYNERLGQIGETLLFAFISVLNLAFTVLCIAQLGLGLLSKHYRNAPMANPIQFEAPPFEVFQSKI